MFAVSDAESCVWQCQLCRSLDLIIPINVVEHFGGVLLADFSKI